MRLIRRRQFLQGAGATLALTGIPLAGWRSAHGAAKKTLGKRDPRLEAQSIYEWYRSVFFDFNEHLSARELQFVGRCMELNNEGWAHVINDQFSYSLFSFSHRIRGSRVNSSRMMFAADREWDAVRPLIANIIEDHGIEPSQVPEVDHAVALGWDVAAGHFKVYMFLEDLARVRDPSMRALLARVGDEPMYDVGLASVTIADREIVERKVYVALRGQRSRWVEDYPFADDVKHINLMVTDRRGVVPQVDLAAPLDGRLNEQADRVADRYRRIFDIEVDTIAYNAREDYTIYFPS